MMTDAANAVPAHPNALRDDVLSEHDVVAVFGLGASGQAACRLLARLGKRVIASDANVNAKVDVPPAVEVHLGEHVLGDATAVVLSPGLNPDWPENQERPALKPLWDAVQAGAVTLISEVELGMSVFNGGAITVGGTDGKSTTAAFLQHLLNALDLPAKLGGNSWRAISDVVLDAAMEQGNAEVLVTEVSAFQSWAGHRMKPDVAILTNIADDHLDHYASFDDYVAAKAEITQNLSGDGTLVYWAGDARLEQIAEACRARGTRTHAFGVAGGSGVGAQIVSRGSKANVEDTAVEQIVIRIDGEECAVRTGDRVVQGAHNLRNIAASLLAVAALRGVQALEPAAIQRALTTFRGLPHRIEFVRELRGTRYFNDSKATNVHAAAVGIQSMARPTIAIVGGVDKKLALDDLFAALKAHATHVLVIGELRARFAEELASHGLVARGIDVQYAETLDAAVALAARLAKPGTDVLLAPACSSFDMFKSFEHRGDVFRALVEALPAEGVSS